MGFLDFLKWIVRFVGGLVYDFPEEGSWRSPHFSTRKFVLVATFVLLVATCSLLLNRLWSVAQRLQNAQDLIRTLESCQDPDNLP